jgi:hypothetical protein
LIPYRAILDVPAELLRYLSRLLAAERRRRGTPARSRKLTCRGQAFLALRWFRDRTRPGRLAADHGISRATAYRTSTKPSTCCPRRPRAWTGPAEPGHVHDIAAAREHALPLLYRAAASGMPTLADGGYEGAGIGIHVPVKNPGGNQRLDPDTKTRNSLLRGLRSQGERGFALLTQRWTALQRITASPRRTTEIVRAALVLTQFEHKYLN